MTVWPAPIGGDCALFCLLGERLPIKYRTIEKVAWQHARAGDHCKNVMPSSGLERLSAKHIASPLLFIKRGCRSAG